MNLEPFLKYPVVFLTGAVVALLLTRAWGPRAARWGFVDQPGPRKVHRQPIPVAGGIAVFLAFQVVCAVVFLYPWLPFAGQLSIGWWTRFSVLSAAVVIIGLVDDRFGMKPVIKFGGQLLVASGAYLLGMRVQNILGTPLPQSIDFVATLFWFLALMNAFNLIDGIDGLATGIAFIAAIGISLSLVFRAAPGDVLLLLGFAGACLGFLRYNFHPARVFLGDTGSLFIGFTLAALTVATSSKGPAIAAIGMPLLAVGIPLFDTLLAVWRRSVRHWLGNSSHTGLLLGVDQADEDHLHHRLLRVGREHHQVALLLYAITAALSAVGILASIFHDRALGILGLAFLLGAYTVVRHLAWIELRDTGNVVLQGIARPVRRNRMLLFYLGSDILILNLALLVSVMLIESLAGIENPDIKRLWLRYAPMDVGLPLLFLLIARSYSRVWYLARISEYIATGLAVALGYAVACALAGIGAPTLLGPWAVRHLLLVGLAVPCIVGVRASKRVLQDMMQWMDRGLRRDTDRGPRTLLCGAGFRATLFLRQIAYDAPKSGPRDIIGLIDDDDAIRGHFVHGIRVLGTPDELPQLLAAYNIDVVYIVETIDAESEKQVHKACHQAAVRCISWRIVETETRQPADMRHPPNRPCGANS